MVPCDLEDCLLAAGHDAIVGYPASLVSPFLQQNPELPVRGLGEAGTWIEGNTLVDWGKYTRGLRGNSSWFEGSARPQNPCKIRVLANVGRLSCCFKDCWLLFNNNRRDKMRAFTFVSS